MSLSLICGLDDKKNKKKIFVLFHFNRELKNKKHFG